MTTIVFSRDRALQLEAFLHSYRDHVEPRRPLHVMYRATSHRHAAAYTSLFDAESWVMPVPDKASGSFKETLLHLLPRNGTVVFFVDDQVFIRPWRVEELPGLSLRLGLNLTYNYNSSDAPQPLPPFSIQGEHVTWRWSDGVCAWRYPLSTDGHVYDLAEFRPMVESTAFDSPNTFESGLQAFLPQFLERIGMCYRESRVLNIPWNRVQTDWFNRSGIDHTAGAMLDYWENGKRIAVQSLYGVHNESVHQEFPLILESRR